MKLSHREMKGKPWIWEWKIPYLPMYNARPCIKRTPVLGLYFQKKKKAGKKNSGSGYEKIA